MRLLTAIRFRELQKIEDARAPLMDGMVTLIHAHVHLRQEPASPENDLAIKQICSIIRTMENDNKILSEKRSELWRAILALDGPALSSPEIAEEQQKVALAIAWLDRVSKRLALNLLECDSREEALMAISELHTELSHRGSDLASSQDEYQVAQAEALVRHFPTDEN